MIPLTDAALAIRVQAAIQRFPAVRRFNKSLFEVWARAMNMVEAGASAPPEVMASLNQLGANVATLRDLEAEMVDIIRRGFEEAKRRNLVEPSARIPEGLSGIFAIPLIIVSIAAAVVILAFGWRVFRMDETLFPEQQAQARSHAAVLAHWEKSIKPGEPLPPLPSLPKVTNPVGVAAGLGVGTFALLGFGLWLLLGRKR